MINFLTKLCISVWVCGCLMAMPAHSEPYKLIAGSSVLGYLENEKQNVNLGFNSVFNELLSSENIVCQFKNFGSSDELSAAIKSNQVNAFFGSPIEFIKSEAAFLPTPIVSGIFANHLKSKILLIVRKDSGIDSLQQLKGKVLSTQKWVSGDIGGLFLETLLLENKLPTTQRFFAETLSVDTSNKAMVDLFFNKVDVALITEDQYEIATELNPQLKAQTKVLIASEPYLVLVTALTKSTPTQEANAIKNSLLTVNKTAKGRRILGLMKVQNFQEISSSDLDNVRALIEKNKKLSAQRNVH